MKRVDSFRAAAVLLLLAAIIVFAGCSVPANAPANPDDGPSLPDNPDDHPGTNPNPGESPGSHPGSGNDQEPGDDQGGDATWPRVARPEYVRGIYISPNTVKSRDSFNRILDAMEGTILNAVVIDVKDDNGRLSYPASMIPWARAAGAPTPRLIPEEVMPELARRNIYPIARIVVFKDTTLGNYRPDLAIRNASGNPWKDRGGNIWLDPYNKESWQYIVAVAREAAEMGFQEIQFDYVRFPSDGNLNGITYPAADDTPKNEVMPAFLRYARASLAEYHVEVSADIFGLVTSSYNGMGIGQVLEPISKELDVVCPMLYPSHYGPDNYGFANPNAHPYGVVYKALEDARGRLQDAGIETVIRPWLQDFTYQDPPYGTSHVREQIRAAADLGINEFLLWNPGNYYHYNAVRE